MAMESWRSSASFKMEAEVLAHPPGMGVEEQTGKLRSGWVGRAPGKPVPSTAARKEALYEWPAQGAGLRGSLETSEEGKVAGEGGNGAVASHS